MHVHKTAAVAALALAASTTSTTAGATTPNNLTVVPVVYGSFGTLHVNTAGAKTDKWGMELKTLAATDVGVDEVTLGAGGYTGWHEHPSPVFVTVTEGSVTFEKASDSCAPHTYTAGQTFIEPAYVVHNLWNASGGTAQFYGVHLNATQSSGPGFLIDEYQPDNCQ